MVNIPSPMDPMENNKGSIYVFFVHCSCGFPTFEDEVLGKFGRQRGWHLRRSRQVALETWLRFKSSNLLIENHRRNHCKRVPMFSPYMYNIYIYNLTIKCRLVVQAMLTLGFASFMLGKSAPKIFSQVVVRLMMINPMVQSVKNHLKQIQEIGAVIWFNLGVNPQPLETMPINWGKYTFK